MRNPTTKKRKNLLNMINVRKRATREEIEVLKRFKEIERAKELVTVKVDSNTIVSATPRYIDTLVKACGRTIRCEMP